MVDLAVRNADAYVDINAVELTKELIRIPSVNPPGDETACANFLAGTLGQLGFETELHSFGPGRFNLVAQLAGNRPGRPVGFTGHFDTVPLGAAPWTFDPFAADEHEGKLYGRGSSDMKAGIACFIAACADMRGALKETTGVQLLLTGGEETGCDGARALADTRPELISELALLIVGEPTSNYPYVGHKGALWMRGTAAGKTAHGSMPEHGVNAIYKATRAIDRLRGFDLDGNEHPLMGRSTMNVGTFHAGLNINSVPDKAEFEFDIRTVPGMDHACLCTQLKNYFSGEIELDSIVDVPPLYSEVQNPVIQRILSVCGTFHGTEIVPRTVSYFTDGSVLLPRTGNPPTIILGPGEPQMAHQTDEYCNVARIEEAVRLYRLILEQGFS